LRREALERDAFAFAASPEDDVASDLAYVRQALAVHDDSVTLGALSPHLSGTVGLHRDRHRKAAHKVHLWGMYVRPECRGVGVGAALLTSALGRARSMPGVTQVHLGVSETAVAALRLYTRYGFRIWGTEPRALAVSGRFVDEHHLVLDLVP
jgi:ribosomal protein S18 acetylase RimI-like enzyme